MKNRSFLAALAALLLLPVAALAADDSLVEVFAIGSGTTQDAAMKAANRAAVEQVVGTIVDATTLVENDDLVENRILTYSAALIAESKIVGTPKRSSDGLVTVKVKATVKKTALREKLVAVKLLSVELDGQSLWAQAISAQDNLSDAEAMIKDVLAKHTACVQVETLPGKTGKSPIDYDPKTGEVSVNVRVHVDPAKYRQFVREVSEKLGQIGLCKWTASGEVETMGSWGWECRFVWPYDSFPRGASGALLLVEQPKVCRGTVFWFDENKWEIIEKALDTGSVAVEVSILDKFGDVIGSGSASCDRRGDDPGASSIFCRPITDWGQKWKNGVVAPWFGGTAQSGGMRDPKHFGFWLREFPGPITKAPPPSEVKLRVSLGTFTPDELKSAAKLDIKIGHMRDNQFSE